MVAIADYLEPDGPDRKVINYYGASYGTIIGATFVNSTLGTEHRSKKLTYASQCSPIASAVLSLTASLVSCYRCEDALLAHKHA